LTGVIALVDYINDANGGALMPGVMALGYIAAFSERLAMSGVVSHGIPALARVLQNDSEDHVRAGGPATRCPCLPRGPG
jgi:hypothetical protein